MRFETWVERQIREAQERGEFDDLPGAGQPLPGLTGQYDELWWVKRVAEREHLSLLPPTLALRKEAEELLDDLPSITSEETVRDLVADYNTRVVEAIAAGTTAARSTGAMTGVLDVASANPDADVVLFASSGTAALDAVLAAIDCGKTIALANKEILVMAGSIVMARARRRGVAVLTVDSEHNAIPQCVHGRDTRDIRARASAGSCASATV